MMLKKMIIKSGILLLCWQITAWAAVDTVKIFSPSMNKVKKAIVVVPVWSVSDSSLYPAVFLLHGYSGSYRDWPQKVNLQSLADAYHLILVCPDGGYNSWYLDSPLDSSSQYETHIIQEVLPFIAKRYPLDTGRRAITGLSMGGHGALYLAARHPRLFVAAASMSGAVDLTWSTRRWEIAEKLGSYASCARRWRKNSVINMTEALKNANLFLLLDCGVDDIFIDINRELHKKMLVEKIDHEYSERPGGHSWNYWKNALEYHLLFFKKSFILLSQNKNIRQ